MYDFEHSGSTLDALWRFPTPPKAPILRRRLLGDDFFQNVAYIDLTDVEFVPRGVIVSMQMEHLRWGRSSERFDDCTPELVAYVLQRLAGSPTLLTLRLDSSPVMDNDLVHVASLPNLELLDVQATKISDSGLKHLIPVRSLRELYVTDTRVTPAGIDELQKALSNCEIIR